MALEIGNKTALVTGGGSGIGLALTRKLLAGGCNVVVADLQLVSDARAVVSAAGSDRSTSPRAVYVQTDVTDWKQLHAAFETAMTEFGRLDIVVPGAGIFEPVGVVVDSSSIPPTDRGQRRIIIG
jgi:NAD(P)-dependent dehydrogenase (short-subunit alcohol dehydrogenase family)